MYEQITVEIDRGYGEGNYRSYIINFIGRLVRIVEAGHTTMRLYEWADRGRLVYLVHVEEDKPGKPPRRTLYPFINTHSGGGTPRKGYTAEEVSRAYPEFCAGRFLGLTRNSRQRGRDERRAHSLNVGRCSRRSSAKRISMQHHTM
ncbi:MAG TPA: hypothetical protein VE691_11575 [Rubrobacter sp.]|nr:hypothetical protein [Rubrobacter sp.]